MNSAAPTHQQNPHATLSASVTGAGKQETLGSEDECSGDVSTSVRLQARELFAHTREVEIDHGGRVYKLRLTQQNKLILTA